MPTPVNLEALSFYVPIARIDRERRIVEGVATSEAKDGHGTIFDYEASKAAFMQWQGNLREMHQPKAVGRAVEIVPDDEHKQIIVRARVSTGANDTWEKVLDGTLSGFSVGAKDGKWGTIERGGESVPLLQSYRMVELSLVDSASNPDANGLAIVRADGSFNEEMLDFSEEAATPHAEPADATTEAERTDETDIERAGKRISIETQGAMHMMRDASISQARMAAQTCGCDECHNWHDSITPSDTYGSVDRAEVAKIVRAAKAEIADELRAQLSPAVQRINALMARDASRAETPDVTRRVDALSANMDRVLSLVEKIANQPLDGGPVLRQVPMDKTLATQASQRTQSDVDILRRALEMGFTPPSTQEAQVALAAKLMPQRP